jgi:hypothetical protein
MGQADFKVTIFMHIICKSKTFKNSTLSFFNLRPSINQLSGRAGVDLTQNLEQFV